MRRLALPFAVLLSLAPGLAAAATPPCLTPDEFAAVTRFALPGAITGATTRCAAVLPRGAFLPSQGAALAARYARDAGASWPVARGAFLKLAGLGGGSGGGDNAALLRQMPDASLQQMAQTTIAGLVTGRLPLDRCASVDRIVALIAPLPVRDTADLVAALVGLGAAESKRGRLGPISVCDA